MELSKFISILSVIFGFTAGIILIVGAINLSSKFIADWAMIYQDENENLIQNFVGQKSDYLIGAILLTISFVLNFTVLILPEKYTHITILPIWRAYIVILLSFVLLFFVSNCSRKIAFSYFKNQVEDKIEEQKSTN